MGKAYYCIKSDVKIHLLQYFPKLYYLNLPDETVAQISVCYVSFVAGLARFAH